MVAIIAFTCVHGKIRYVATRPIYACNKDAGKLLEFAQRRRNFLKEKKKRNRKIQVNQNFRNTRFEKDLKSDVNERQILRAIFVETT